MTILIDNRVGSAELLNQFPKEIRAVLADLEFADFNFIGNGPNNTRVSIGIERKKLTDLLSNIGRFTSHQLPGMLRTYDYNILLLEGVWRRNLQTGLLEIPRRGAWKPLTIGARKFTHSELDGLICSITFQGGFLYVPSQNAQNTVALITYIYKWWARDWNDHKALRAKPNKPITLRELTLLEKVAAELPGIGQKRAMDIGGAFPNVGAMVNAEAESWLSIPGIGKKLAEKIIKELWRREG